MKKLICTIFTLGLACSSYSVWAGTSYETTKDDKSILMPAHPRAVEPEPIAKTKPINPDKKMTNNKSDDKTKAERDEELKKEYEQNMKK